MSKFPNQIDDDTTLPPVNDNITEDGGDAINATRDAIFNIETNIGIGAAGTAGSISQRLAVSLNPDGTIIPSAINSLSLDYTQIKIADEQVLPYAGIQESKLSLNYGTNTLFNYIQDLARSVNCALSWIDITGVKLEPHLAGVLYQHTLSQILVSAPTGYLLNRFGLLRNNSNSYALINDLNSDYIAHQVSDGTVPGSSPNVTTPSGIVYPSAYAHSGTGVYIDTSIFSIIPQTTNNLQLFAEYVDNANTLLLGTKTQTLFQNGISRSARSTMIGSNADGSQIVPPSSATTFLLSGGATSPVDTSFPPYGDDIILFTPVVGIDGYVFQSYLNAVSPGDVATVNYGSVVTQFLIKEINPTQFTIRIAGKNFFATTAATVGITRKLDNKNKFGVLAPAIAPSPSNSIPSSLILGSPRGAEATGIGFNATSFDNSHYNLYLQLYPTGNPSSSVITLVPIDVTANGGITPAAYTLDGIVQNVNTQLRKAGYNYRFIAFEYQGEFGIMLADSYNGAAFSIIAGATNSSGQYDPTLTLTLYPNNVVDVIHDIDPLGLGTSGANVACPAFSISFPSAAASLIPTVIINPLQRNFYYINGGESDRFAVETEQLLDGNGDSYWPAAIAVRSITSSTVQVTYVVNDNLSNSSLEIGKTLVVQPAIAGTGFTSDFGRFTIQNVVFSSTCTPDGYIYSTSITVYDAVHGSGVSPYLTSGVGFAVNLYFGSDSVAFSNENVNDLTDVKPFKRFFETYLDQDGYSFGYERARFSLNGMSNPGFFLPASNSIYGIQFNVGNVSGINNFNIIDVSPKLTGYTFTNGGVSITKINLQIISYSPATGAYTGYLRRDTAGAFIGPLTTGKRGEVTRFYDESAIDYIDVEIGFNDGPLNATTSAPYDTYGMDIQLYPSLRLDDELLLVATCQFNDSTNQITYLEDRRQFGNISEQQLSDSAISFIEAGDRYLHQNGVIRGFNVIGTSAGVISLTGGFGLVNGSLVSVNPESITIPPVQELFTNVQYNINWLVCVDSTGQFTILPLTNYDPVLMTPNTGDRVVTVIETVSLNTYMVDAVSFENLINVRTDLTPLYLAAATVSGSTVSLSVQDIRKYVVNSNSILAPTLTDQYSQGNFRNLGAALTWFKYNSVYQNKLAIKSSYTLVTNPGLNNLIISGDGVGASLTIAPVVNISNTSFDDVNLSLSSTTTTTDCSFSDLTIIPSVLFTDTSSTFNNVIISFPGGATLTGSTFNNCLITVGVAVTVNTGCTFNDCDVVVTTIPTAFVISPSAANVKFVGCSVYYAPSTTGTTYSATNLINSGYGFIYSSVALVQNVTIDSCEFTTNTSTRFPFISFEYKTLTSVMQTIRIANNKFYNTASVDDPYAVIAFTSTLIGSGNPQPLEGLRLIDCIVDKNLCDKNQMISITGAADGSPDYNIYCTIAPMAVKITNNVCGIISILPASTNTRNYETYSNAIANDKYCGIEVSSNTCKWIGATESTGQWVGGGTDTFYTLIPDSAPQIISRNFCSWIMPLASSQSANPYDRANITISDNTAKAYNITFLSQLGSGGSANVGILTSGSGTYKILGNLIATGKYLTSSNTTVDYDYINCLQVDSAGEYLIDGNTFNSAQAGQDMIQLGTSFTVTNNHFIRNSTNVSSYIRVLSMVTGGIITNNTFDQTTIDGTSEALLYSSLISGLNNITYTQNKNQIGYAQLDSNQLNWSTNFSIGFANDLQARAFNTYGVDAGFSHNQIYGWATDLASTSAGQDIAVNGSLDQIVPPGAQLLYVVVGFTGTGVTGTNPCYIIVQQGKTNAFTPGSFSGSQANYNGSGYGAPNSGYMGVTVNAVNGSSVYSFVDVTGDNLFSSNGSLQIIVDVNLATTGSSIIISPILVRYKW